MNKRLEELTPDKINIFLKWMTTEDIKCNLIWKGEEKTKKWAGKCQECQEYNVL